MAEVKVLEHKTRRGRPQPKVPEKLILVPDRGRKVGRLVFAHGAQDTDMDPTTLVGAIKRFRSDPKGEWLFPFREPLHGETIWATRKAIEEDLLFVGVFYITKEPVELGEQPSGIVVAPASAMDQLRAVEPKPAQ